MDLKNTKETLNKFAKYVVTQSKANLTRKDKNVTDNLYKSIGSDLKVSKNSFYLSFLMDYYGLFQDKGVKGVKSGSSLANYSFKPSSNLLGLELATGTFAKWAKARGLRYRDDKGRFKKGGLKNLGIAIALGVKNKGIKPSLFFTKPFEAAFDRLPNELTEAFALDVENFMEYTTKNILKNGKN